jgi:hypothetical protein
MITNLENGPQRATNWPIFRDLATIVVLFLLTIYVVYFTSPVIARFFFLIILAFALVSRKDYLWFVYFFVLAEGPGHLFADFSGASQYRLPMYTIVSGMSFTPIDFFVVLILIKALVRGRKVKLRLEKPLLLVLAYIIFSISLSAVLFRTSIDVIATNLRWLFCYSIIISFSALVYRTREIHRFVILLSPFVFFVFFTQVYYLTTGSEFVNLFDPGFRGVTLNTLTGSLRPVMGGGLIVFASYMYTILLMADGNFRLPKVYLYTILIVAFLSVFLSATRLWFVIFAFIFVGYTVVSRNKVASTLGIASVSLVLISLLIFFNIIQMDFLVANSWGRVQQVFDIAKGNVYSVDTAMNRLVNQLPVLLAIIRQNPFIGYGFSYITMYYYDSDLGFLNTILMFGIVGFGFLIFFFIRLFAVLISSIKRVSARNSVKIPLKIMVVVWLGILIGYFSTWEFFTRHFNKVIFVSLLIAFVEFLVMRADKDEIRIQNLRTTSL